MTSRHAIPAYLQYAARAAVLGVVLAAGVSCVVPDSSFAVTAAEKRAEADEVFAQIDSLQTNLNKVMEEYESAQRAQEDAMAKRDKAAEQIEQETKNIEKLQNDLSEFAVGMYKQGGAGTFLDVVMDTSSFEEFLTTWDVCSSISQQGTSMIEQSRDAREKLEKAKASYEKQGERAESQMDVAAEKQREIEETQAALRSEAEKLSNEADELQRQEEAAAEAARQAEEARKQREAELAAAAEAAAKAEAEAQAAAEKEAAGEEADDEASEEGDEEAEGEEGEEDLEAEGEEDAEEEDETSGDAVVMGTGFFTNPCPSATSSSGFGYREFDNSFHKGLDMAAPEGTPYYAADSGTVMYATNDGGYNGGAGNWVVISHGNGIVTKYMHSSATYVQPGDFVERGQNIGAVGNTGQSFGAHLHFQVEVDGVAVNPLNYI